MANIILLNGSSSAGKTTLAHKLQQLLPEPYQHIAFDQFRDGMPARVRGLNAPAGTDGALGLNVVPIIDAGEVRTRLEFGAYGQRVLAAMRATVAAFADLSMPVIVDDLILAPAHLQGYAEALRAHTTWFVGVHCPLEVVSAREQARPGRFPGTAAEHHAAVHSHGVPYDIEVNTASASPRAVAEQIIDGLRTPPAAFNALSHARSSG